MVSEIELVCNKEARRCMVSELALIYKRRQGGGVRARELVYNKEAGR